MAAEGSDQEELLWLKSSSFVVVQLGNKHGKANVWFSKILCHTSYKNLHIMYHSFIAA